MNPEDTTYLVGRLSTYLGLLLLGTAAGTYIALGLTQNTVYTSSFVPLEQQAGALYPVLLTLQTITNTTGIVGAAMILAGGTIDVYHEEVTAWISS